jgi:hypothetical protein
LDPSASAFDYYPVRADMAHSWVEVWFPGYGWIEYDPTTENLAAGEEFRISPGVPQELFERLMREIFGNRGALQPREGTGTESQPASPSGINLAETVRKHWPALLLCLFVLGCAVFRLGPFLAYCLARDRRKKARLLWGRAVRLLRLAGLRRPAGMGEGEWAGEIDRFLLKAAAANAGEAPPPEKARTAEGAEAVSAADAAGSAEAVSAAEAAAAAKAVFDAEGGEDGKGGPAGVYRLYQRQAMARFAPDFTAEDLAGMKALWPPFTTAYRRAVPAGRRILSWILPAALPRSKAFGPF